MSTKQAQHMLPFHLHRRHAAALDTLRVDDFQEIRIAGDPADPADLDAPLVIEDERYERLTEQLDPATKAFIGSLKVPRSR
jgi:hypothetical protein